MSTFHTSAIPFVPPRSRLYQGPYGRLFPDLPPFEAGDNDLMNLAGEMVSSVEKEDNEQIPAAYTYFGQFITHDITFDPTSILMRQKDPEQLLNFRTPSLDLDSLYGSGPEISRFLYQKDQYGYLLTGKGRDDRQATEDDDLPRNEEGMALISDPRNDEHTIISQLHLLFIKFHNSVMDYIRDETRDDADLRQPPIITNPKLAFPVAQKLVRWHYQWLVIRDYAQRIVDPSKIEARFPKNHQDSQICFYHWKNQPYIPVEFSAAVFRFGHSMVRPRYDLNNRIKNIPIFAANEEDLRGKRFLRKNWSIQWHRFLPVDKKVTPQFSKKITSQLSTPVNNMPGNHLAEKLAFMDLKRGVNLGLPAGQDVARVMGLEVQRPRSRDPLWFYILKEAEEMEGRKLGPVGETIVIEVLAGLITGDPHSYINIEPRWEPIFPRAEDDFRLADIVRFVEGA